MKPNCQVGEHRPSVEDQLQAATQREAALREEVEQLRAMLAKKEG